MTTRRTRSRVKSLGFRKLIRLGIDKNKTLIVVQAVGWRATEWL